ncbi:Signal peptidase complex catalytic subunit S11C [Chytridiales sp. JEL 0842]|nr:Signal peptidase complex catalytic subunit S11C [Chytridiales sp. JEL 0842]
MEPAFQRGDLLFLTMNKDPIRVGEIVVFKVKDREIPIVHRVLEIHEDLKTGEQFMLTKGDHNSGHDRPLYAPGQMWVKNSDVVGRVQGILPYVGMVTIILNDYPQLKFVMLAVMGLFVLFSKEE